MLALAPIRSDPLRPADGATAGSRRWTRPRYLAALVAASLVVHEAHELAHTAVGRLACGGWGPRDFNTWRLPAGCASPLATATGPALSYALMLVGAALVAAGRRRAAASMTGVGVALALAPNPFARLLTAAVGGGDEGVLVRALLDLPRGPVARAITLGAVLALSTPALVAAWRAVGRARPGWFVVLLLAPTIATGLLLLVAMNRLLAAGVLARPTWGAPALVHLVTLAAVLALVATGRWLAIDPGAPPSDRVPD